MLPKDLITEHIEELKQKREKVTAPGTRHDMIRERISKEIGECQWALDLLKHEDAKVRRLANFIRKVGG